MLAPGYGSRLHVTLAQGIEHGLVALGLHRSRPLDERMDRVQRKRTQIETLPHPLKLWPAGCFDDLSMERNVGVEQHGQVSRGAVSVHHVKEPIELRKISLRQAAGGTADCAGLKVGWERINLLDLVR